MDRSLSLDQQEYQNAMLELLMRNYAQNEAIAHIIASIASDSDNEKFQSIMDVYDAKVVECEKEIFDDLFLRRGSFGIDDALKG